MYGVRDVLSSSHLKKTNRKLSVASCRIFVPIIFNSLILLRGLGCGLWAVLQASDYVFLDHGAYGSMIWP